MKKENCYLTLMDALNRSEEILGENELLTDGVTSYDTFNLREIILADGESDTLDGTDGYYCVGFDGSIGITHDSGYSVEWFLNLANDGK